MKLENLDNSNYLQTLVYELMKHIPPVPPKKTPEEDKIGDRVALCKPNTYDWNYNLVELEEWIRGKEKIFYDS